ncbi:hypothetical protein PO909_008623 [Leuciscus waleckii]
MVDMFSKWIETFPTSKQDAAAVAKALLTEIVPRWGVPRKISSDNGRHFVNEAIKQVGKFLGIDMRTHCAYHAASGGAVERENQTVGERATWVNASHCRRVPPISGEQQEEEPRRQTTTTAKPLVLPGPPEIERASGEELAWMRDEGNKERTHCFKGVHRDKWD